MPVRDPLVLSSGTYPLDHTGSSPKPREAAMVHDKDFQLMKNVDGSAQQVGAEAPAQELSAPGVQSTSPPTNPEGTASLQEANRQIGELTDNIGKMRLDHQRQLAEIKLMFEMNQATGRGQAPAQAQGFQLPQGVDPEGELKVKDLFQVLQSVVPALQSGAQAQAIRATWDVTTEEEAEVMKDYPQLASMPDLERSRFIQKAARLRKPAVETAPTPAPVATAPTPQQRPMAPTVPQPESAPQVVVAEPQQENPLQLAQQAYVAAKENLDSATKDADRKKYLGQMKQAHAVIQELLGQTSDVQQHTQLIHKA